MNTLQRTGRRCLAGLLLLAAATGLASCGSGSTTATGNVLVFTITDPIDACTASQVILTGLNFLSEHGDQVVVRFEATEGTPFEGGTASVIEVTGTAVSNTQIDFLSPIALDSVNCTITIILPGGVSGASTLGQANLVAGQAVPVTAVDDTYTGVIGNIQYDSGALSVLDNDLEGGGCSALDKPADGSAPAQTTGLSLVTHDLLSANGGEVAVASDGTFTYNPPPGYEGTDTFGYTMTDGLTQASATVFITVADVVWFIDNEADAGGDGRFTGPFDSTPDMNDIQTGSGNIGEADPGDYIFYYGGARVAYPGELTLLANQHLIGNGVDLVVQMTTIVPASSDPVLENLSLVSGAAVRPPIITLADGTEVRGLTIDGAAGRGILGNTVVGPILIDNVDVLRTGDDAIRFDGNPSGTITIGDPADMRSVRVDETAGRGIYLLGGMLVANATLNGCTVDNTGSDAMWFRDLNVTVIDATIGQAIQVPAVTVPGHGLTYVTTAFQPLAFTVSNASVLNCGRNGINIEHLGEGEAQKPGSGGPAPLIGTDELSVTIADTSVTGATGDGLFVSTGGSFQAILLAISDCDFVSTGTEQAIDVRGRFFNSLIVTACSDIVVSSGNGTSGGVIFDFCTFDADPLAAGIQSVAAGTWTVGQGGSPIEGDGMTLFLPAGDLTWTALNLTSQNGDGLVVDTQGGVTVFTFDVGTGTISAPDGTAIVTN